ncbi:preprotein translocase subunit SecG [Chlamydiifrater phoenicopteri]|uniref:preprotein translocase subunit SecG n=1 Tax=Chlamydiifrater phoenicopteri TaxID=2681469 RepID=UPI001BD0344A|nr:preprotein translocase subunit SecG [Chlamydiifrater phoenicopteri]
MVILFYAALFVFLTLSAILCALVLVQESKSMGLGSSFGVDSGDSVFGVSTPDVLKKATAWFAGVFCVCCLLLSVWTGALGRKQEKTFVDSRVAAEQTVEEDD